MSQLPDIKIDTKAVGEPLTKLIECVSKGIGKVFEPYGIVRKASADAKAKLILADADDELARRAAYRLAYVETRRQAVIEAIVGEAKRYLPASVSNEPVSEDWIHQFFDDCKDVGDGEIRTLWARILAGEVASPRKYSRRTLQLLKTFECYDALAFTTYCSVAFTYSSGAHFAFENAATAAALKQMEGSEFESHLISLGLLAADTPVIDVEQLNDWRVSYFGRQFMFVVEPRLRLSSTYDIPQNIIMPRFFTAVGGTYYCHISEPDTWLY